MSERRGVTERPEPIVVSPTPLEAEFDHEIGSRFNTALSEPFVSSDYDLVRGSTPVQIDGRAVAFQYRRFDVARSHVGHVLQAFEKTYPDFKYPSTRDFRQEHKGTPWEDIYLLADFGHSKITINMQALDEIRQRIESQGGYDAKEALSNPNYYIPGKSITQFPEIFEAAVFHKEDGIELNQRATPTGRHGKIDDKRPDIYATFQLGPSFVDYSPVYSDKSDYPPDYDDHVVIRFPKLELVTHTAYVSAFQPSSLNLGREDGLELDDISFFPRSRPLSHRVRAENPDLRIRNFVELIEGLTKN